MLILSRHINERIMIGDGIVITVCRIERGRVELGITAPPDVPILREELIGRAGGGDASAGTEPPLTTDALYGALSGLYAHDMGAVSGVIYDEATRDRCAAHLRGLDGGALAALIDAFIRVHFLDAASRSLGYGEEDAVAFIDWLEDRMGIDA